MSSFVMAYGGKMKPIGSWQHEMAIVNSKLLASIMLPPPVPIFETTALAGDIT
jgi:hypothetical protein